jgi:hypothetical protein
MLTGENLSLIPVESLSIVKTMLTPHFEKLKVVVTGQKLKKLVHTWQEIFTMDYTETEMLAYNKNHLTHSWTREELNRLREIHDTLVSRLETFKKVVESL